MREWHGLKDFVVSNSTTIRLGDTSWVMAFFSLYLDDDNGYIVLFFCSHIDPKDGGVIDEGGNHRHSLCVGGELREDVAKTVGFLIFLPIAVLRFDDTISHKHNHIATLELKLNFLV